MATIAEDKMVEPWLRRLYLPAYQVSEAARYVGVHPNTISAWHHRGNPVLPGRTKGSPLSYLELIEVAFVAFFRRLNIDIDMVRKARDYRISAERDEWYDVESSPDEHDYSVRRIEKEYPFASLRFKTERLHILMEYRKFDSWAKKWTHLTGGDARRTSDWIDTNKNQFAEFDYAHQIVIRWHLAGRDSQVMIDPRIAFGAPMVSGLPIWVIRGRYSAGETIPEIADDFEICESAILDALAFEGIQVA